MIVQKFEYIATICGGIGPDTWDREIVVSAMNIQAALAKVQQTLDNDDTLYGHDGVIVSIEQKE